MSKQATVKRKRRALIVAWVVGRAHEASRIASASGVTPIRVSFTPHTQPDSGAIYIMVQGTCKTEHDRAEVGRLLDVVREWLVNEGMKEDVDYFMRKAVPPLA